MNDKSSQLAFEALELAQSSADERKRSDGGAIRRLHAKISDDLGKHIDITPLKYTVSQMLHGESKNPLVQKSKGYSLFELADSYRFTPAGSENSADEDIPEAIYLTLFDVQDSPAVIIRVLENSRTLVDYLKHSNPNQIGENFRDLLDGPNGLFGQGKVLECYIDEGSLLASEVRAEALHLAHAVGVTIPELKNCEELIVLADTWGTCGCPPSPDITGSTY